MWRYFSIISVRLAEDKSNSLFSGALSRSAYQMLTSPVLLRSILQSVSQIAYCCYACKFFCIKRAIFSTFLTYDCTIPKSLHVLKVAMQRLSDWRITLFFKG